MAGAVNPDGWASSLGVSNDDDAVGVVEDLRARVQGHADTVGRLQDRVRSSPGDVSVLLRQAVFLLDSAADELVKVQGRVCPPRTRSPLMRARVEVMSDVLVSVCQPFAAVVWSVRRSLPAAALAPPGPGRGERALQRHPTSGTPKRLYNEVRWLPCSPSCANWLRYGVTPKHPGPDSSPGQCLSPAHDRENLGPGGRRVLVSRQWSSKTLTEHRADRRTVVTEVLTAAGIDPGDADRLAADQTLPDGTPRYIWEDAEAGSVDYVAVIAASLRQARQ